MQKRWIRVAVIAAGCILVIAVLIPLLVSADSFRPRLETQLSQSLGRRVSLGHLSFSLLRGSLVADDIVIADDPAFGAAPFLRAKSFHIGVEVGPLLFHRQVRITRLTIDSPSISLIHAESGKWNFSSLGGAPSAPSQQGATTFPDLTVGALKISDGAATVSSLPATGKPFVYNAINLSIQDLSFLKAFPFQLSAQLPASGSLSLNGTAGPVSRQNAEDTPFRATLALKQFDPVAAGVVEPNQGIAMSVDIDAQLASDGATLTSNGKIRAAHLQLARTGSPAPQPIDIDYAIADTLAARTGRVTDIAIHAGSAVAHLTGTYQLTPKATVLDLHLAAANLPLDPLEQLLPAFGVSLPTQSALHGGTLTANLAVTGPATETTIAGPVEIDNTKLAGFNLGSKIQGFNPLGGSAGGTEIQTLRATVNSSPQTTQISNIYGNLPQIGSATGSGTVSPAGALDFKMTATLASSNVVGAAANQAANAVGNLIGGFLHSKPASTTTNRGIPLTITGTTKSPSIRLNVVSMLK